jgi:predicted nucleic acid-binding protein
MNVNYVIDASVGIKLFVDEPFSDKVQALFDLLAKNPPVQLFVPDLFYIECTNILLKYTQRLGRSIEDTSTDIQDLNSLALKSFPTKDLMKDALILSYEKKLTAYDACYAALAKRLEIPLVTADERMIKVIDWAIWIGDL